MTTDFFACERRVTFAETDAAGIAHFSHFSRWVEEAELAFWREHGFALPSFSDGHLEGFPKVAFSIRYRVPVRFNDVLTVALRPTTPTERTVEWSFQIRRGETLCASGSMLVAFASGAPLPGELKSHPLPAALLALLKTPGD